MPCRSAQQTTYDGQVPQPNPQRPLSALPSPAVRIAAFAAILIAGLAGGLIGFSLMSLQCSGTCGTGKGLGAFSGAILAAIGMSVVAVLVMRAIGEWNDLEQRQAGLSAKSTRPQ